MPKSKSSFLVFILILSFGPFGVLASEIESSETYIEGKKLIQSNCYDCYKGTKEGLERGISILESLAQEDIVSAELHNLLAEAYFTLANAHYDNGTPEQSMYRTKGKEAIKRAYELNPGDLNLAKRFVKTLAIDKQIAAFEKMYQEREDADAAYSIGMISFYHYKEFEKGIVYLKRAYEKAEGQKKITFGGILLDILKSRRSSSEYEKFKAIYEADKKLIYGS